MPLVRDTVPVRHLVSVVFRNTDDPLSTIINTWVGSRYFFARQYDRAIEQYRNAIEMDPAFVPVHLVLGHALDQKHMLSGSHPGTREGGQSIWRQPGLYRLLSARVRACGPARPGAKTIPGSQEAFEREICVAL